MKKWKSCRGNNGVESDGEGLRKSWEIMEIRRDSEVEGEGERGRECDGTEELHRGKGIWATTERQLTEEGEWHIEHAWMIHSNEGISQGVESLIWSLFESPIPLNSKSSLFMPPLQGAMWEMSLLSCNPFIIPSLTAKWVKFAARGTKQIYDVLSNFNGSSVACDDEQNSVHFQKK